MTYLKTGYGFGFGASGVGAAGWTADFATPPDIATSYTSYLDWVQVRRLQFEAHCPSARGTTYHFAQSGDDSTGDGSEGNPWKTIAKAQAQIDAAGQNADLRLRFNRGDIWKETTGILTDKDNITIDAYGTGAKPEFNRFTVEYLAADDEWTLAAGDRYTVSEANDIAWIREIDDKYGETRGTHLIRQDSAANVEATDNSWWWDSGTNTLHINLAGDNPNDIDLEAVITNAVSGVEFQGDGCRAENIIADGWGCSRTDTSTQDQGFTNRSFNDDANYYKGVEAFYGTSHTLAHNAPGVTVGVGGKSYWYDCVSGFTKYNSSGETVFNSFSQEGGQETWFVNCEVRYGTLKSSDWSYATLNTRGIGFFCHTNGVEDIALIVTHNCTVTASHTGASSVVNYNNIPTITGDDLTDCRAFETNCTYEQRSAEHDITISLPKNTVVYGNFMYTYPYSQNPRAFTAVVGDNCYLINNYIYADMTDIGNDTWSLYNTLVTDNDLTAWHNTLYYDNVNMTSNVRLRAWDFDVIANGITVGTGSSQNGRYWNNVVQVGGTVGAASSYTSATNTSDGLKSNAYYQLAQDNDDERGYNNDAGAVDLSRTISRYDVSANLLEAGTTDIQLSHDITGKARTSSTPDIGPYDYSSGFTFNDLAVISTYLDGNFTGITVDDGFTRTTYRQDEAQSIRDGAGPQSGQEIGLQSGVSVGTSGVLATETDRLNFSALSTVTNTAESGSGTEEDPYILYSNKTFDGNSGADNEAMRFTLSDAVYIKIVNCEFFDFGQECIEVNAANAYIEFENCEFYNNINNDELFLHSAGNVTLDRCLFSGCNSFAAYLVGSSATGTLTIRNLQVDASQRDWDAGSTVFFFNNSAAVVIDAQYIDCDTSASSNTPESLFELRGCGDGSSIQNFEVTGVLSAIIDDATASNNMTKSDLTIQNFNIVDVEEEAIRLNDIDGCTIRYGFASHTSNGAGHRLMEFFSDSTAAANGRVQNLDVEYIKFTKQTGSGAGNECLESARGENVRFRYCWVTECTEDAFEHINVISGCTVEYCVGDNVVGQIVDIFKQWDEATWGEVDSVFGSDNAINSQTYVHHIYGDCSDHVLTIDGMRGLAFHDIYGVNTDSSTDQSVRIQDRDSIVVRQVRGAGPLPQQSERGNGTSTDAVLVTGGADIEVNFYDSADGSGSLTTVTN